MPYDESDPTPFSEPTTENATKFHLQDVPAAQRRSLYGTEMSVGNRWRRLHGYNTGLWNGNWGDNQRLRRQDNQRMFDAMAGYLGLTRHQRERACYLLHDFRFSKYSPYYTVRDVSLIVCILVANADYRGEGMIYHPNRKYPPLPETGDLLEPQDPFRLLIDSLGVKQRVLEKGIPKFRAVFNQNRSVSNPPI